MNNDDDIELSGPFTITDSLGRNRRVRSIRIACEGYGRIEVYVPLTGDEESEDLHQDPAVIRQIIARLRRLGYTGADFGAADEDLQDSRLIVLEAPEEFAAFAALKGWRNIAEDYLDEGANEALAMNEEAVACVVYAALMRRLGAP